jgi:hypothetical protein
MRTSKTAFFLFSSINKAVLSFRHFEKLFIGYSPCAHQLIIKKFQKQQKIFYFLSLSRVLL